MLRNWTFSNMTAKAFLTVSCLIRPRFVSKSILLMTTAIFRSFPVVVSISTLIPFNLSSNGLLSRVKSSERHVIMPKIL